MATAKRIFLFLAVNVLIMLTITITVNIVLAFLGVSPQAMYQSRYGGGLDLQSLMVFCLVWGFAGAFISLALSRFMAKMLMGVKVIDPNNPGSSDARDLVSTVHRLARSAGLPAMPEVGIFNSPEVNAFATGPTKSRALVAVSSGLLQSMDDAAVEGVLAHEITHISNGDMVTMTLLQGLVNSFVLFFSKIAAWALANAMSGNDRDRRPSPWIYYLSEIVFQILFSLLGMIVVAWFSRRREFRADSGGAGLAGRDKMIHALQTLKSRYEPSEEQGTSSAQNAIAALKINGRTGGFMALISTHPPLDVRIAALRSHK